MPASDLVQALARGLVILEHLAAAEEPLPLNEVCRRTDLKSSTAHNLLRTLCAHGFVAKLDRPTRYALGPAVGRLVDRHRSRSLVRRVRQAMRQLHVRLPDARISFAEAIGGEVVTTLQLAPELRGRFEEDGMQAMNAYASASALLHQALWPAEQRAAYRRRYPFTEYGSHLWKTLDRLDRYLDQVRDQGLAEPPHGAEYRVAAPVFDRGGTLVGVLGIYLPGIDRQDVDRAAVREMILTAAATCGAAEAQSPRPLATGAEA